MIGLDAVVGVLLGELPRGGHHVVDHPGVDRCPVGGDLNRGHAESHRAAEERAGCEAVSAFADQDVDDLAAPVDSPIQVDPVAGDLDVGLVHEPPIAGRVPGRPGGVNELCRERVYPAIDRHVVDVDAPFSQQLLDSR